MFVWVSPLWKNWALTNEQSPLGRPWFNVMVRGAAYFSHVLCLQISEEVLEKWVHLIMYFCEDEQETEMLLAAAEVLKSITSFLLSSEKLILGK